ncbi:MAG: serine/threonine-protein kinase [Actinomycetota bacterium]
MENLTINGRYRILQQIGIGGFGLTYLAEDLHLPTRPKCVVKHLKPQITDAETMHLANRLFQQEAEILYRLGGHPNIPSLIAHFRENGEFYLVQEFIEGHTIAQEFAGGRRYNQQEMIQLIGQTLEILSFVHRQNVIHRDIKPANLIRRTSDGSIFLIDFGAVKQVNAFPHNSQNSTFSTLTIGSHGYMPVEQMAGKPNFSSDLYALGLVAVEALTGIKPLELKQNNNTNEHIWAHRAQLSPEVGHFISKLVRYDFRQRFASAAEALNGLNVIAGKVGFFQSKPAVQISPIGSNNHAISAITLSPPANPVSTPTAVPQASNAPNNFIPPTVIVPTENVREFQNFQPPPLLRNAVNNPPKNEFSKRSPGKKIGIFIVLFVLFVAGLVFGARIVVKNFQPPGVSRNNEATDNKNGDQTSQDTVVKVSDATSMLFEEAIKQAEEARVKEKSATTKFEWEEIGNKYKRAYGLLSTIDQSSSYYGKAQEKLSQFKQKADDAFQKSLEANGNPALNINNPSNVSSNNVPVSSPNPTTATTTTQSSPKVSLTMPPKQPAQNYLAYNYYDGYEVRQKIVTSNDSLFTSKVERNSYDEKDSKAVLIKMDGSGSGELKFKPPAYTPKLTAGNYPSAREISYQVTMNYAVSFNQFNCYPSGNHSFRINSIIYNDLYSNVSLLDATFVLSCGNRKLMGRIHYDAR